MLTPLKSSLQSQYLLASSILKKGHYLLSGPFFNLNKISIYLIQTYSTTNTTVGLIRLCFSYEKYSVLYFDFP